MNVLTRVLTVFLIAFASCSDVPDQPPQLADVDRSERAWTALVTTEGTTYWFEESICGMGVRETTVVQVENQVATLIARGREEVVQCEPWEPYRYELFHPATIEDLYDECRSYIERGFETALEFDVDGIISSCRSMDDDDCHDACDYGFSIARRGFGRFE